MIECIQNIESNYNESDFIEPALKLMQMHPITFWKSENYFTLCWVIL